MRPIGGRILERRDLDRRSWLAGVAALALAQPAHADRPASYPRSYARLEDQARREGRLLVYSSLDPQEMSEVLRVFRARYPQITVEYKYLASRALYDGFLRETAAGRGSADLVFNSAMDLQIKLVNDGYAQAYASPEKPNMPARAVWKNEAYGVTAEPLVFAYNKKLVPAADVPRSHDELERLLRTKPATYRGKVISYDVEHSNAGFLFLTQDEQLSHDTWRLLKALGKTKPKFYVSGEEMVRRIGQGEHLIGYNLLSSHVLKGRALNPSIEVVFPSDYTLVLSRIAFISKEARHPAAAKIFLDFLLSRTAQEFLAHRYMTPVRTDLSAPLSRMDASSRRLINVSPGLIANLDQMRQRRLIAEWRDAVYPAAR